MTQLMDHIEYLSKEIGPRPAGTEEEQEAALYIADQLQQEAGFHAEIEEFTSSSNLEGARAIPSVVIILVVVLAMLFNVFTIPALILTLLAGAVYVTEAFGHHYVSKMLARGASQNVVAKYQPGGDDPKQGSRARTRKIVLVAHYDTGKVKPGLVKTIESTGLPVGMICIGAMALAVLLLLVRIFLGSDGGVATAILNVITVLDLIVIALPIVKAVLYRVAPYNEGANNNASGTATLIEVAKRISQGSVSEAELASESEEIVIHGLEAAIESGLVSDGVQITYETDQVDPAVLGVSASALGEADVLDERDEKERLLAAKAAIAALTGRPVDQQVYTQPSMAAAAPTTLHTGSESASADEGRGVSENEAPRTIEAEQAPAQPVEVSAAFASFTATQPETEVAGFQNAPSWFVSAQKNAKKSSTEPVEVQKSRYNQAIENAERERAERERERAEEQRQQRDAATRDALEAVRVAAANEQPEDSEPEVVEEPKPYAEQEVIEVVSQPADAEPERVEELTAADEAPDDASQAAEQQVDLGQTIAWQPVHIDLNEMENAEINDDEAKPVVEDLPAIEEAPAEQAIVDLPPIEVAEPVLDEQDIPEIEVPSRSGLMRKLRTDVPSLSGIIRAQEEEQASSQARRNAARSAMNVPDITLTAANDASQADVDYDMDVSSIDSAANVEAGSLPQVEQSPQKVSQVEMPSSRANGFIDKLRDKDDGLDQTPQEWLNVDENFDARTVGRERGSWESFREDAPETDAKASKSSRKWEGGAFSRVRLGHVDTRSGADTSSDEPEELVESDEDRILNEEIGQIIHFRNPDFNTEVWFVAVGSDTELHDGAKAFIEAHSSELRGAMVIEMESLGAGALSVASEEGQFRKTKASSRVKRYVRPAVEASGIALENVKLNGADSVTTTMQNAGYQAMHLFGMENGSIALKGSADDVFENVEELTLEENVNFIMELLKRN